MSDLAARAAQFRALHVPGTPLVLFNAWDAGSAKAVEAAGAKAIATGSWSVAASHGYSDGEALPFDLVRANARRISSATTLPFSLDLERGYGASSAEVRDSVAQALACGIVGCNIEDSMPDGSMRETTEASARIAAAREAADRAGIALFINARTDVFFQEGMHDIATVDAVLDRAHAYAAAGADGLFVPALADEDLIGRLVKGSPLPVNVMAGSATSPLARLAELGVARVSHGPGPYRLAMKAIEEAARAAM